MFVVKIVRRIDEAGELAARTDMLKLFWHELG
jgi:hypothetical protein